MPQNPKKRSDLIDFVIVSRRPLTFITTLIEHVSADAIRWCKHHFIIVYDRESQKKELQKWLSEHQDILSLPKITVCVARPGYARNINALRAQALDQGENPYVYFQDDDDPLPEGLDHRIHLLENSKAEVAYGISENVSERGQLIEQFPPLNGMQFTVDVYEAVKWFPSYIHPLSGLFKRTLFEKVPLYIGRKEFLTSSYGFMARLVHSGVEYSILPDKVRTIVHHADNDSSIFSSEQIEKMLSDIALWSEMPDIPEDVKTFYKFIARQLAQKEILTYREISALVEIVVEEGLSAALDV